RAPDEQLEFGRNPIGFFDRGATVAFVLDRQPAESRPREAGRVDPLTFARRYCMEPSLIGGLRDEAADVRVHPPCAREEEATVGRHRVLSTKQMLEDRSRCSLRMNSLRDLTELLWVAE